MRVTFTTVAYICLCFVKVIVLAQSSLYFSTTATYLHYLRVLSCLCRGVVGRERVGTAFPHLFHVFLQNEFEAAVKWSFLLALHSSIFVCYSVLRRMLKSTALRVGVQTLHNTMILAPFLYLLR